MQRRPAGNGNSIFVSEGGMPVENENRWLARQFLIYAERLGGFIELTPAAVTFLVEILPLKERWAVLEKLKIEAPQEMTLTGRSYQVDTTDVLSDWLKSKDAASSMKSLWCVLFDAISNRLSELENDQDKTETSAHWQYFEEMDELVSLFRLSCEELSIVVLCYCYSVFTSFEGLCDSIATRNQVRFLSACIQTKARQAAMRLHKHSNLRRYGIIEKLDSFRCWLFRLSDKVLSF